MDSNEVIVKVLSDNLLKVGHNTEGNPMFCLDSFTQMVDGVPNRFFYKNEQGDKSVLQVEGQRVFNLENPIDAHNWDTLKIDMALHPELRDDLLMVDPNKDADDQLEMVKRRTKLIDILLDHEKDTEWLAKVYRMVVGMASGITAKVMLRTLVDKAQTELDAFGRSKWLFDSENFETEAMLDLAVERGVLTVDDGFYKKPDGSALASDRAKAVYMLNNDGALRAYITQALNVPLSVDRTPDTTWAPQVSDDVAHLITKVGEKVESTPLRPNGSLDEQAVSKRDDQDLSDMVDKLIAGNIIMEVGMGLFLEEANQSFNNKDEVLGFLKTNPAVVETLKELIK